jgi:hypothetical protein
MLMNTKRILTIQTLHEAGGIRLESQLGAEVRHVGRIDEPHALLQELFVRDPSLDRLGITQGGRLGDDFMSVFRLSPDYGT